MSLWNEYFLLNINSNEWFRSISLLRAIYKLPTCSPRAADREKGERMSEAGAPLLGSGREVTQTDLCRAHEDRYEAMAAVRGGGRGVIFPSWGDSQLSPKKYR